MSSRIILLADNDPYFLESCAEFLEAAGYRVLKAESPCEALASLEENHIHLAILDLRLLKDDDKKDISGLAVARDSSATVPKIVLTRHQSWEAVRDSLGTTDSERPAAAYFVAKQEGLNVLLDHVQRAFVRQVAINWDLTIDWKDDDSLSLARLLEDDSIGERLLSRGEEIEDLFRRLFFDKTHIDIHRRIWSRKGLIALHARAISGEGLADSFLVVCGQSSMSAQESSRYRKAAPSAHTDKATAFVRSAETTHFGANTYTTVGTDLEELRSIIDLYHSGPEKTFSTAMTTLFEVTLAGWQQSRIVLSEDESIEEFYRKKLSLKKSNASRKRLDQSIHAIIRQTSMLGLIIERSSRGLAFRFGGQPYAYPEPTNMLYQDSSIGRPLVLIRTPGLLAGDNILVDPAGNAWLTDFSEAGLAPTLWNHIQMEAAIRFDWVECKDLSWLHDMERCLGEGEFARPSVADIEPPLRKAVGAIQRVRRLASRLVGDDPSPYHLGIFFQAAKRIVEFSPKSHLTTTEIARLGHALIAAAMIAGRLGNPERHQRDEQQAGERGVRIDAVNRRVWVNGRLVSMSKQSYQLLCVLHERPDGLFTRQELGVRLFGEKYNETDISHVNRLNTAIFRLRDRIEYDSKHPRFLVTDPGGGYRLVIQN